MIIYIKNDLDVFNDIAVKEYIETLCESKSYKNRLHDRTVEQILEHFYYNRTLVTLNKSVYPKEVINTLSNYITYNCNKDLSAVEYSIAARKLDLQDVLDFI